MTRLNKAERLLQSRQNELIAAYNDVINAQDKVCQQADQLYLRARLAGKLDADFDADPLYVQLCERVDRAHVAYQNAKTWRDQAIAIVNATRPADQHVRTAPLDGLHLATGKP